MRTHKKFKKVLSVVLSAALVVTGVNLPGGKTAKAAVGGAPADGNTKQIIQSYKLTATYTTDNEAGGTATLKYNGAEEALDALSNGDEIVINDALNADNRTEDGKVTGINKMGEFSDSTVTDYSLNDLKVIVNGYTFDIGDKNSDNGSITLDSKYSLPYAHTTAGSYVIYESSDGLGAELVFIRPDGDANTMNENANCTIELYAPAMLQIATTDADTVTLSDTADITYSAALLESFVNTAGKAMTIQAICRDRDSGRCNKAGSD